MLEILLILHKKKLTPLHNTVGTRKKGKGKGLETASEGQSLRGKRETRCVSGCGSLDGNSRN